MTLIVTITLVLMLLAMLRSLLQSLGADPEDAVAATARISTGDLTERLNAKKSTSLIGALEIMQSRLRNISIAIHSAAQEIKIQVNSLPESEMRSHLNNDIEDLYQAINRIKIDRDDTRSL